MRIDLSKYEVGLGINYEITNLQGVVIIQTPVYDILNPIVQDEVIKEIAEKHELISFNVVKEWDPCWPVVRWREIEA